MKASKLKTLAAVDLALGAGSAVAALPAIRHQGEVAYLTGGVGQLESESILQAAPRFPLALEFVRKAAPHDEYLANVAVKVSDRRGRDLLDVTAEGPFLLARLPSGEYTVKATFEGRTLQRQVHVAEHASARTVFVWPAQP